MLTDDWGHAGAVESEHWVPASLQLRKGMALCKCVKPRLSEPTCTVFRKLVSTLLMYVLSLKFLSLSPTLDVFSLCDVPL